MATTIVTKNGSGAPTASDLVAGELAVDLTNGRLYTEDSGGSVIEIGLNPSGNVDITGTATMDGLTVDGDAVINDTIPQLQLMESDTTDLNSVLKTTAGQFRIQTINDAANSTTNRFIIDHSTGDISFYEDTGTTAKLFWDASAESLGVGTDSPDSGYKLDVAGNVAFGDGGGFDMNVDGTRWQFSLGGSEKMRIDASGNILVGKTSDAINVAGVVNYNAGIVRASRNGNSGQFGRISTNGDIVTFYKDTVTVGNIGVVSDDRMYFATADGLGLQLDKDNNRIVPVGADGSTFNNNVSLGSSGLEFKNLYLSGAITSGANGGLIKEIGGDTSVVQGAVGLRINDFASALSPTTASANNDASVDLGLSNVRFKDLYLSGKVIPNGVTTTATAWQSTSNSTSSSKHMLFANPNGNVGDIRTNGSATAYITSSDYRLKENVVDMSGATERLKQLKPSRFNFIADPDTTVDGFLAHEVQEIVPEAIAGEKDAMIDEEYEVTPAVLDDDGNVVTAAVMGTRSVPDYQGIDQSKLVPLLVATIQELEARIAALES